MKLSKKKADALITALYGRFAQGRQISVLDIGKVFAAGRAAMAEGRDLEVAIKAAVDQLTTPADVPTRAIVGDPTCGKCAAIGTNSKGPGAHIPGCRGEASP